MMCSGPCCRDQLTQLKPTFPQYDPYPEFPRPTRGQIERHAKTYGDEFVADVAAHYGITLTERKVSRSRKAEIKAAEARALHEEGYRIQVIADKLGISDRRVQQLLKAA